MDKALPSGGKDSEFESWGGRFVLVLPLDDDILNRLLCFMKERVLVILQQIAIFWRVII